MFIKVDFIYQYLFVQKDFFYVLKAETHRKYEIYKSD